MQQRFARTTFFIMGALLIWLATFVCVYVFAALACARGFAHLQVGGLLIVPFVTITGTFLAAIANLSLLLVLRKLTRDESDEHAGFLRFVALASTVIVLVSLAWLALPAVLASSCNPA
jgi:hypothetical protein